MKVEGRHHWKLEDLDGNILKEDEHSNVTTDAGLDMIAGLVTNIPGSDPITAIAFGIGATKGASEHDSTKVLTKDSSRTESDNFWKHAVLTYTSGENEGDRREVTGSGHGFLSHLNFPNDPETGDTYVLSPSLSAIQLGDEPSGSGWRKAVDIEIVKVADHVSDDDTVVRLIGKFSGSEAQDTLNECGLFTSLDSGQGVMMICDGFPDLVKGVGTVLTWIWELTLSR